MAMKPLSALQMRGETASLEQILRAFGAHNWTPAMIKIHKESELAKAPPPSFLWRYIRTIREVNTTLCVSGDIFGISMSGMAALFAIVAWAAYGVSYYLPFMTNVAELWLIMGGLLLCVGVLSCFANWAAWKIGDLKILPPAGWVEMSPGKFGMDNMPPEARRLIEGVRMAWPDVPVKVHVLRQAKEILDPILEIDGRHPLVWDKDGKIVSPYWS